MNPNRPRPSRAKPQPFEDFDPLDWASRQDDRQSRSDFKRRKNLGHHDWLSKEDQEDLTAEMAQTA